MDVTGEFRLGSGDVLTADDAARVAAWLQTAQRDINCLADENRNTRRRAVEKLRVVLQQATGAQAELSSQPCRRALASSVIKPLLRLFADPGEKCREVAIGAVSDVVLGLDPVDTALPYVLPVLVSRLAVAEPVEPAEELRLAAIDLLCALVGRAGRGIAPFVQDVNNVLLRTLFDRFPEAKKASCKCVVVLAAAVPDKFHYQAQPLVPPLVSCITHPHSRVRQAGIEALCATILNGAVGSLDELMPSLAALTNDNTASVRRAAIDSVGRWMRELTDRYSNTQRLVPLLFSGLSDESPEVAECARANADAAGALYEAEYPDEVKDRLDYDPSANAPGRPRLGLRLLVQRNVGKILPAVLREVCEWTPSIRTRAAGLLYQLLLHSEAFVTQHLESVLSTLSRAVGDEEPAVAMRAVACSEVVGRFVDPDASLGVLLPQLRLASSPQMKANILLVLGAVLRGGLGGADLASHGDRLASAIADPEVCRSEHTALQEVVAATASDIIVRCFQSAASGATGDVAPFLVFQALLCVQGLATTPTIAFKAASGIEALAAARGRSVQGLYEEYLDRLLGALEATSGVWTKHSPERALFETVVTCAGPAVASHLSRVCPLAAKAMDPARDPDVRVRLFALFSRLVLENSPALDPAGALRAHTVHLFDAAIAPNCVWRAGRTAAAVRTAAVTLLWALLRAGAFEAASVPTDRLVPVLVAALDDDNQSTRRAACHATTELIALASDWEVDRLHQLYPELLKRLDDSSDEIRAGIAATFAAFVRRIPADYDRDLYRAHLELMYRGLLVHLDDPNATIQEAILEVLKAAAPIHPSLLLEYVLPARHKHRTSQYCDALIAYVESARAPQ